MPPCSNAHNEDKLRTQLEEAHLLRDMPLWAAAAAAAAAWCSIACWDIFAGWSQLKHSWPVFTGLSVLKAYLRWKGGAVDEKKKWGERESEHRGGKKKADFRTGKVQRDLRSCVICLLSFDPWVDFLSLFWPSCSSLSLTGNRRTHVHKASGSRFTLFPSFVGQ